MVKVKGMDKNYEFDYIAENIFFPIYAVIADDIIKNTGITEGRMLDIGCGGGHLGLTMLQKTDLTGVLIDINKFAIEKSIARAKEWGLDSRAEILEEDVTNMSFEDNSFDLIVSRGSIGFWKDIEAAFKEIYRVLKPGGKTYIGGGLGNKELVKEIYARMADVDPDWPKSLKERRGMKKRPTEEYRALFEKLGFGHVRVLTSENKGRWFVIEKDKEE